MPHRAPAASILASDARCRLQRGRGVVVLAALILAGCATAPITVDSRAVIVERTRFRVAHITAQNYEMLAYGTAYAHAEDHVCTTLDNLLTVRGERSLYFGPKALGPLGLRTMPNAEIDLFVRMHMDDAALAAVNAESSDDAKAAVRGYVAGFNRYLRDVGVEHLPAACRGAEWARPMTVTDFHRLGELAMIQGGSAVLAEAMLAARPPAAAAADTRSDGAASTWDVLVNADRQALGSNGWAFGSDVTSAHTGLLLGNPHFPWVGPNRFWQMHLTIPGKLDVMGASIGASPVVHIGFNRDVAWTHTVSTGKRYTLYELRLMPGDPTSYMLDGKPRNMTRVVTTIPVRNDDGSTGQQTATTWHTVWGPVLAMPRAGLAWTAAHAYAIRDGNAFNGRSLDAWLAMDRATSVEALLDAMNRQGMPWVNTIAADRTGKVLYADLSNVPDLTAADLQRCAPTRHAASLLASAGLVVVDGSRTECAWRKDPAAAAPGLIPAARMPVAVRRDWVQNSNDSFWLTNPAIDWPDISPLVGSKATPQGLRTRMGLEEIRRQLAGRNGSGSHRMNALDVETILFSDANLAGMLVIDDLRRLCSEAATDNQRDGCAVLARWDRTSSLDARGAPLFREFWRRARSIRNVWRVPFDASRPVDTPLGLNLADASVKASLLQSIDDAASALRRAGFAIDVTLRTAQVKATPHGPVPVPGGEEFEGVLNKVESRGLTASGYDIDFGSSYIQLVTFDGSGPIARGMLTYGQAGDPSSPYAYDQLDTFSRGEWPRLPYTRPEIDADRIGSPKTLRAQ
jgi:acyl-homoserine-lactone acylase